MSVNIEIKVSDRGLKKLIEAIEHSAKLELKVGIIGDSYRGDGPTNAYIGRVHEFGIGTHERSFLRMPIQTRLYKEMSESGAFTNESLARIIKEGSFRTFYEKTGVLAEKVIKDAFDSEGFGKWEKSNMKYKKIKKTLSETLQLRRSITSRVDDV